jgi:hypothetical protein
MSMGSFERAAELPANEIAQARNDLRNALLAGFFLYDGNKWDYGEGAFGLRLLAWIVRKASGPYDRLPSVPRLACPSSCWSGLILIRDRSPGS